MKNENPQPIDVNELITIRDKAGNFVKARKYTDEGCYVYYPSEAVVPDFRKPFRNDVFEITKETK